MQQAFAHSLGRGDNEPPLPLDRSFFDLGGDSLRALRLSRAIHSMRRCRREWAKRSVSRLRPEQTKTRMYTVGLAPKLKSPRMST